MVRKWLRRGLLGTGLALLAAGIWAGSNWNGLQTKYAAHRLKAAATDEERAKWAEALAQHDEGAHVLVDLLKSADAPVRSAAATSLQRHLDSLPAGDSR